MKLAALAFAIGLTALAAPVAADVRDACRQDRDTLCKGVEKGDGRVARCMAEHRTQLSSGCKLALADRMLERRAERGDKARERSDRPGADRR